MKNLIIIAIVILNLVLASLLFYSCNNEEDTSPEYTGQNTGTPCSGLEALEYGGQTYHTVQIGDQCWMRENLNIGNFLRASDTLKNNDTIEKYCYKNDLNNCDRYGGMYTWDELMNYTDTVARGICPEGWHIPTDQDWTILEAGLDSLYTINDSIWDTIGWRGSNTGGRLKMSGLELWYNPNVGGVNAAGFTAVPGGILYGEERNFDLIKGANYLWSSTKAGDNAWFRLLSYAHNDIRRSHTHSGNAFSVRCIKD